MQDEQEPVNEEVAGTSEQTVNQEAVEQPTETDTSAVENVTVEQNVRKDSIQHDLDDRGVPWRNRAMEAERKLNEFPTMIPKIIEETLEKREKKSTTEQYNVEHIPLLRKYAVENPENAGWAEQQITNILIRQTETGVKRELETFKQQQVSERIRDEALNEVQNHPIFKNCFTKNVSGQTVFNVADPLAQRMSNLLNSVDPMTGRPVYERPDAIRHVAYMAYGQHALSNEHKTKSDMQTLKKDLKKAQKATMVSGGGTPTVSQSQNAVRKSLDNYSKTYNKTDMASAVKNYLSMSGMIKNEE